MKRTLSHMLVAPGLALCLVLALAGCGGTPSKTPEAQAETTQEQAPTTKAPTQDEKPAEEAQYAVDNISCDWSANALAKAKDYQDMMSMSPNNIYDQLTSDYGERFTPEEAQYAVDHLND